MLEVSTSENVTYAPGTYRGVILNGRDGAVWVCSHRHSFEGAALTCGMQYMDTQIVFGNYCIQEEMQGRGCDGCGSDIGYADEFFSSDGAALCFEHCVSQIDDTTAQYK
jgi:hypothetical protein